jgi:hypothetical protein
MHEMIKCLTKQELHLFAGYTDGFPLDPYVILSAACGGAGGHGYWVQPFGDDRTGLIQPIRLAA